MRDLFPLLSFKFKRQRKNAQHQVLGFPSGLGKHRGRPAPRPTPQGSYDNGNILSLKEFLRAVFFRSRRKLSEASIHAAAQSSRKFLPKRKRANLCTSFL